MAAGAFFDPGSTRREITADKPVKFPSHLTHAEADKRANEARFARIYLIRLQLS